jgi:hypothetical protein
MLTEVETTLEKNLLKLILQKYAHIFTKKQVQECSWQYLD